MIPLGHIRDSFEGVIPSVIATTDAEGLPNISYLSHVHLVDDNHVALSNQFLSKTAGNVAANGLATVMVVDGLTGAQHILDLIFDRSETEGALFDRLAAHLSILEQGMAGIMRLKAADIYRVLDCKPVPAPHPLEAAPVLELPDLIEPTARLSRLLAEAVDTESLLDTTLDGLARLFGIRHAMVLVPDDSGKRMITIASAGYERFGFGAEVPFGEGVIGISAASRQTVLGDFLACGSFDVRSRLGELNVPTLLVGGTDDLLVPPHALRATAEKIAGAKLQLVPDTAHLTHLEKPEPFLELLTEFLQIDLPAILVGVLGHGLIRFVNRKH